MPCYVGQDYLDSTARCHIAVICSIGKDGVLPVKMRNFMLTSTLLDHLANYNFVPLVTYLIGY
jgi:hypothetical protein